ncbi:hypothetical protein [Kineococcus sp. SYSU DK004]|uniref:hypothetical protein n=1 Tax=Kineococcus sp. SYSU DK004 TaxID=3383125 RepID=UPI003D7E3E08
MDAREAETALAQAARRRQQTIEAGTRGWSARATWTLCLAVLTLGILTDADMTWLWFVLVVLGGGTAWSSGVRLRRTGASHRWQLAVAASALVAFAAYVLFQFPARALDWPLPNTVGALGACLVVVLLVRPVQARLAASLRP